MSEIAQITDRDDGIDIERVKRLVRNGTIAALTPDRESAPFLMYLNGLSCSEIAFQQAIPRDIIEATALHYDWNSKREAFHRTGQSLPQELQKRVANTLLITTYTAVTKELADVASGNKEAKDCLLIPKSIGALRELIDLVNIANGITPNADKDKAQQVAVQIINTGTGTLGAADVKTWEAKKAEAEERAKVLAELATKIS